MGSRKPISAGRTFALALGISGVVLAASNPAIAADAPSAPVTEKRLVYLPHKYGYPFNLKEETRETAEFARVEAAPANREGRRGPPMKTGAPFPHID